MDLFSTLGNVVQAFLSPIQQIGTEILTAVVGILATPLLWLVALYLNQVCKPESFCMVFRFSAKAADGGLRATRGCGR